MWMAKIRPTFILHECVAAFEMQILADHLEGFTIISRVFSPTLLGLPCNRKRRYSLAVNTMHNMLYSGTSGSWKKVDSSSQSEPGSESVALVADLKNTFTRIFQRSVISDCSIYLEASDAAVQEYLCRNARDRGFMTSEEQVGQPIHSVSTLSGAHFQRMLAYRMKIRAKMLARLLPHKHIISNLEQTAWFCSGLSPFTPALLTKSVLMVFACADNASLCFEKGSCQWNTSAPRASQSI